MACSRAVEASEGVVLRTQKTGKCYCQGFLNIPNYARPHTTTGYIASRYNIREIMQTEFFGRDKFENSRLLGHC